MFKDVRTYIIAGLGFALIIFVLRDCSRPSEQKEAEDRKAFEIADAINKADKLEAQAIQDSIGKVLIDSIAKINAVVKSQDRQNAVLTKQLAKLRTPRVDTLILDNPDLKSFVDTQTEIIQEQRIQIDTLKSALEFHAKVNQDLIAIEFAEDKIEAAIQIESTRRIAELEKEGWKKERGKKGWKVVAIVGTFLGFLGGSQL